MLHYIFRCVAVPINSDYTLNRTYEEQGCLTKDSNSKASMHSEEKSWNFSETKEDLGNLHSKNILNVRMLGKTANQSVIFLNG